ncbi:DUF362 domain-containing protein [Pectinatus brassicae]|uniref:DUF362 domain-containing protein n=1 Tax=Pectinatus brassicae TaxID=862415 RepID=UPI0018C7CE80|nr:4Fe-4S binding protein [Pectinatus brassicae]
MKYQIMENCRGCGKCAMNCPVQAIVRVGSVYKIDKEKCIECGKCYSLCPFNVIKMLDEQSPSEIIATPLERPIDTMENLPRTGLGLRRGGRQNCRIMGRGKGRGGSKNKAKRGCR